MAFWKKFYKSRYTGAEIDAAVAKAGDLSKVTANPTLAGTEAALTGLEVGETKYKVEQPINVVANPTLAGTEAALEGLQVGNTKYKVEVYPTFELSNTEWGEISTAFGTFLYSLSDADGLVYKQFTIETNAASVIEKLKAVINSGSPFVYDKLPADFGGYKLLGIIGITGFSTFATSFFFPIPISKRILVCFDISFNSEETEVIFTVTAQVTSAAS